MQQHSKRWLFPVIGSLALGVSTAQAADIRFNGFASVIGGFQTNEPEVGDEKYEFLGYNQDPDFKQESRYGLQATADMGEGLSFTAQIVGRGEDQFTDSDNFSASLEWAYMTYEANDYLTVYAGRLRRGYYIYSEFLDVGYAYNWVRPPESAYDIPLRSYDGVKAAFNFFTGPIEHGVQFSYGNTDATIDDGSISIDFSAKHYASVAWTGTYEVLQFNLNLTNSRLTIEFDEAAPILEGLKALGLDKTAEQFEAREDSGSFIGIGAKLDWNNILVVSEYTKAIVEDSWVSESDMAWYISAAYRMGSFTPYITFEEENTKPKSYSTSEIDQLLAGLNFQASQPGLPAEQLNALQAAIGAAQGLRAGLQQFGGFVNQQSNTISLGMRWDWHPNAALKAEYGHRKLDYVAANEVDDEVGIVSIGVDVVF